LDPVVLFVVAKVSAALLHRVVLPFGLTFCVRVDGNREAVIDTEVGANSVPKSAGKLFPAIFGNIVQYPLFADYLFEEDSC
jgi:hypothetical protein